MSPIEGVSDIVRLPRLGKVRLGIKEVHPKTHNPYPRATDFFVCPEEVQKVFGEKPKELRIMFPVEEDEVFAPQYYKCYSMTRGLICRGDGKTCTRLVDLETGALATRDSKRTDLKEMTCPGEECPQFQSKQCRRVMNLQFFLPEVPGLGVWQLDTSSFFSIVNINSGVKMVKAACGRIRMVPLILSLGPREVSPEGKKKTVNVLNITSRATLADILKIAAQPTYKVLLPPPDTEPPEDLFPEEVLEGAEASTRAPREELPPDKDLFPDVPAPPAPGSPEEALALWQEIKVLRERANVTNNQVRNWFRKACGLELFPMEVEGEKPPPQVTVEMLKRLHLSLSQYQPRLGEKE